ncbi:MAG: lipid A deacylase LpxR family protein [Chromatiales bacterium]
MISFRAAAVTGLLGSLAAAGTHAVEVGSCEDPEQRPLYCGTYSILFENDLFAETDRFYTNGIKLSWLSRDLRQYAQWQYTPVWLRGFFESMDEFQAGREKNLGFFIGQKIFTPEDIERRDLIEDDRSYAGWLYGGMSLNSKNTRALDTFEVQLGWVGSGAQGEETQNFVHDLRGIATAKGWDNQLENEPAFSIFYQRKQRLWDVFHPDSRLGADVIGHAGGAAGTVYTYANAGIEARFGLNIPADFGTSLIRPGGDVSAPVLAADAPRHDPNIFGAHFFAALTGRAVLRDIFLDGNTYEDSHSVEKEDIVGDLILGAGVTWQRLKLTYAHVLRTKEFEGQDEASQYGSVNLTVTF